jgi:hypothetical protein
MRRLIISETYNVPIVVDLQQMGGRILLLNNFSSTKVFKFYTFLMFRKPDYISINRNIPICFTGI